MREAFSGTALFLIVIFFVVLFTGYLCMSINQNKAFAVKNAIVRIVERHGVGKGNLDSLMAENEIKDEIFEELDAAGYRSKGKCDANEGWKGYNVKGENNEPYVFCLMLVTSGGDSSTEASNKNPSGKLHYYKVKTFYQFDIPGLVDLFQWSIEGTTKAMM